MIEINFPTDPSRYVYYLSSSSIADVYLVARAARHYGPSNIDVVQLLDPQNHHEHNNRRKQQAMGDIANLLGIQTIRGVGIDTYFSRASYEDKVGTVSGSFVETILDRALSDYTDDDQKVIGQFDIGKARSRTLSRIIAIAIDAGIINTDGTFKTPSKTIALSTLSSETSLTFVEKYSHWLENHNISEHDGPLWAPLVNYTERDILQSAKQEGLEDVIIASYTCRSGRMKHCGICLRCINRRHSFLQAEINDCTQYELV